MIRTRSSSLMVVDSCAASLRDYLKNEISGLGDRHRATTIAQHVGQTLASQARIECALREHDVGGIAAAPFVLDRVGDGGQDSTAARFVLEPRENRHSAAFLRPLGNNPAWI